LGGVILSIEKENDWLQLFLKYNTLNFDIVTTTVNLFLFAPNLTELL